MEKNEQLNKPTQGTYDNMQSQSGERKPQVKFIDLDKPYIVSFKKDYTKPTELPGKDGGVFYLFNCIYDNKEMVFMTSAWSLMQGLKANEPLAGKSLAIKKSMKDGKQNFDVKLIEIPKETEDKVEVIKPEEKSTEESTEELLK